jgi:putative oxidoreductase
VQQLKRKKAYLDTPFFVCDSAALGHDMLRGAIYPSRAGCRLCHDNDARKLRGRHVRAIKCGSENGDTLPQMVIKYFGEIMRGFILTILFTPTGGFFAPQAVTRIVFGLFFAAAGFNKLMVSANSAQMLETITAAGIPFAEWSAVVVAGFEFISGMLLAAGVFARINALALLVISLVALLTVGLSHIPHNLDLISWYSWLLYLPESLYILICVSIIRQGAGPFSVDRIMYCTLSRRWHEASAVNIE